MRPSLRAQQALEAQLVAVESDRGAEVGRLDTAAVVTLEACERALPLTEARTASSTALQTGRDALRRLGCGSYAVFSSASHQRHSLRASPPREHGPPHPVHSARAAVESVTDAASGR